jgi:hypothetical protein
MNFYLNKKNFNILFQRINLCSLILLIKLFNILAYFDILMLFHFNK